MERDTLYAGYTPVLFTLRCGEGKRNLWWGRRGEDGERGERDEEVSKRYYIQ
jgi:hypothetical protein